MTTPEEMQNLDARIRQLVDDAVAGVRQEFEGRLAETRRELVELKGLATETTGDTAIDVPTAAPPATSLADLEASLAALGRGDSQESVLTALIDESARFADRTAFLVTRENGVAGWGGRGLDGVGELELTSSDLAAWQEALAGHGCRTLDDAGCDQLVGRLSAAGAHDGIVVPFVLRDRIAGVLYADRASGDGRLDPTALRILTHVAGLTLETLPFRGSVAPVSLLSAEPGAAETTGGLSTWGADAAVAAGAATAPFAETEVVETETLAPETFADSEPTAPEPQAGFEASALDAEFEAAAESLEETALDLESAPPADMSPTPDAAAGAEATPEPSWAQPAADRPPADEPIASEPTTDEAIELEPAAEEAPVTDWTIPEPIEPAREPLPEPEPPAEPEWAIPEPIEPTAEAEPQEAVEPEQPAADPTSVSALFEAPAGGPEPPPSGSFTTAGAMIVPPNDLDGPGSAFTERASFEVVQDAAVEEAKRLARLLVSEIKLYNEEEVVEGRRSRDIYARLREDIDRSREIFNERVDPAALDEGDFFQDELVRILAGGDAGALGS